MFTLLQHSRIRLGQWGLPSKACTPGHLLTIGDILLYVFSLNCMLPPQNTQDIAANEVDLWLKYLPHPPAPWLQVCPESESYTLVHIVDLLFWLFSLNCMLPPQITRNRSAHEVDPCPQCLPHQPA